MIKYNHECNTGGKAVKDVLTLIDQIADEHREILKDMQTSEHIANDFSAIRELEKPIDEFVQHRLSDEKQSLRDLKKTLDNVDSLLKKHFDREEKSLLKAFKTHRHEAFVSSLTVLLDEHQVLLDRIARLRREANELMKGDLSRHIWEGKAYAMRTYLRQTQKMIQAHAETEWELMLDLRKELERAAD